MQFEYGNFYESLTTLRGYKMPERPPQTFDCVYLHVFKYVTGGKIKDFVVVLSERQFRRAIARAKNHPELVVKHRFRDWFVVKLFKLFKLDKK